MIKLTTKQKMALFQALKAGDTFLGGDNKFYIKIPTVAKTKNFDVVGTYNAVCITDGELAFVAAVQPVGLVNIKAEVIL